METAVIIGGDLRNFHLYNLCRSHTVNVTLMGFEKRDRQFAVEKHLLANQPLIIGPIPLTLDGSLLYMPFSTTQMTLAELNDILAPNTTFVTGLGGIPFELPAIKLIDLTQNERFLLKNAIPTVEGIIEILIRESDRTIHNSRTLVLGLGRIGTRLSKVLRDLGSNMTIASGSPIEKENALREGYQHIHLSELPHATFDFDYIINTIPSIYLTKDVLDRINTDTLILDIASMPGGIDRKYAEHTHHQVIIARGIPGKSSPRTGASDMFDAISDSIKDFK
ncbi:dipicolinate synthase subunit A [Candidatus Moduliflexus flocculans]|uniref:Dipicolinate synthase subunit A n=1 Tax=Candidatus Moduliflexus flocculans TaxID=1499966 RepID=A0A0S6VRS0_9BACT|nr:dipicolinate synthase subunit A [Candidatus Moduliflexus flocculans]